MKVYVEDPYADKKELNNQYQLQIEENESQEKVDVVVIAVAHDKYKKLKASQIQARLNDSKIVIDIKNIMNKEDFRELGMDYWNL